MTAVSTYPDGLSVVKDGSSCHQAGICKQRQSEYNIQMQENPQALLDLSSIWNIWFVFKNLLGKYLLVPKTWDELVRAAEEVWNTQIMLKQINPVIKSMEHHVEQVLTKHGDSSAWLSPDGAIQVTQPSAILDLNTSHVLITNLAETAYSLLSGTSLGTASPLGPQDISISTANFLLTGLDKTCAIPDNIASVFLTQDKEPEFTAEPLNFAKDGLTRPLPTSRETQNH
ncbi:uncharacterized protein UBRO_20792 [Ustilago bromivora]|uniref:Uncharacterized protein n=1 Tax=Ustilago bromivora TaxID=307758 RepID=A0A1K0G7Z9_9BASI|nr:uncharacterized protein UBRO_20792 [Ustilago bromivora]